MSVRTPGETPVRGGGGGEGESDSFGRMPGSGARIVWETLARPARGEAWFGGLDIPGGRPGSED